MVIDWNASEISIKLTPIGKPLNRQSKSMSVYKDYGDNRIRAVQAIANMVEGETLYISSICKMSDSTKKDNVRTEVKQTIPVSGWRGSVSADYLMQVAVFLERAFANGMLVECFGSSRAKWRLEVEFKDAVRDVIDNMSDKGLAGDGKAKPAEVIEANGLRVEF